MKTDKHKSLGAIKSRIERGAFSSISSIPTNRPDERSPNKSHGRSISNNTVKTHAFLKRKGSRLSENNPTSLYQIAQPDRSTASKPTSSRACRPTDKLEAYRAALRKLRSTNSDLLADQQALIRTAALKEEALSKQKTCLLEVTSAAASFFAVLGQIPLLTKENKLQLLQRNLLRKLEEAQAVLAQKAPHDRADSVTELQPASAFAAQPQYQLALALYDFTAERVRTKQDTDLPLTQGDLIEVLSKETDGWWLGRKGGVTGVFPSTYTEVVDGLF